MEITPYDFSGKTIRIIIDEKGDPWWVASEVCCVLGLTNPSEALKALDDDEKNTLRIAEGIRGNPNVNIINEPGLYRLLSRSNKKRAKKFQRWAFHDALPSIRKTGYYSIGPAPPAPENLTRLEILKIAMEAEEGRIKEEKARIAAEKQVAELAPKAEVYDLIANSKGLTGLSDTAKLIGVNPRWFTSQLRKDRYLFERRRKLVPFQPWLDAGILDCQLVRARDKSSHLYRQTFVTPKGVLRFAKEYGLKPPPGTQRRLFT
jgi:prophage antirepressor-like protein